METGLVDITTFDHTLAERVTLEWEDLYKGEWVGESGVELFDPSRVVELILQVDPEQSGLIWIDDLYLISGSDS